jgi:transposase
VTTLFAGVALQARRRFGIAAQHLHIDTTSFSVSGDYASKEEGDPVPIAITYGYSRDHREDLKQWMLALATTHDGDVPLFLRPLDGNSSDKEQLSAAVKAVMTQLREQVPEEHEQRIAVFDSGGYSQANMKSSNDANIWWISRVPETSTAAKNVLRALISCTSAWLPTGTPRCWGCKPFISRYFVYLVQRIHNSIFSLPKLRNVGSENGKAIWRSSVM